MNQKDFRLRIDSTNCTSMIAGTAFLGKDKFEDTWWYRSLEFESGKIYALISEYGQGCRYLSYLLGGRVDFEDLKVYLNENEVLPKDLSLISWNLEASGEDPLRERKSSRRCPKTIQRNLLRIYNRSSCSQKKGLM